ncbi:MAG: hypothetical protein KDB08_08075 [Microthrixaceae bacterium]|nr:hypothetical protein [Microthrixaceae bacterium]
MSAERPDADRAVPAEFDGGDPVCWLNRVCEECGAFIEGDPQHDEEPRHKGEAHHEAPMLRCPRCGHRQRLDA